MKKIVLSLLFAVQAYAVEARVSPQWLHAHLEDKNLVVIEVSNPDVYAKEHIKNAQNTSIKAWREVKGDSLLIRSKEAIQAEIRRLGIDEKSEVVLYAPIKTPRDLLMTSYVFLALDYNGISNVGILEGGLQAYKKAGYPVTQAVTPAKKSSFVVTRNEALSADKAYVLKHIEVLPMIDARPSDKYLGITPTPTVARDGHIKGAMSYSWDYSITSDYMLKARDTLDAVFKEGYALDKEKEVLVYCTGGLETSFNYYVLKGLLGYKKVRLYDASMKEWGNTDDTPMVRYVYERFTK